LTIDHAIRLVQAYEDKEIPSEEDFFLFTEAMDFLIHERHDPRDMVYLGGTYYEKKDFHLAKKYYEMAAEYGDMDAHSGLGYIYYYGRTGEPDYEKAFYHFNEVWEKTSDVQAGYKIADMYKNGYYVEKSYDKYAEMIEKLWPLVKDQRRLYASVPEIATRLADIRAKKGDREYAIELYLKAKDFLSQRIRINPFFGNFTIMKLLIENLYQLIELDYDFMDFWDLYEVLKVPCRVTCCYERRKLVIGCEKEDDGFVYYADETYYRTIEDLMMKGTFQEHLISQIAEELYDFEVEISEEE